MCIRDRGGSSENRRRFIEEIIWEEHGNFGMAFTAGARSRPMSNPQVKKKTNANIRFCPLKVCLMQDVSVYMAQYPHCCVFRSSWRKLYGLLSGLSFCKILSTPPTLCAGMCLDRVVEQTVGQRENWFLVNYKHVFKLSTEVFRPNKNIYQRPSNWCLFIFVIPHDLYRDCRLLFM